MLKLLVTMSLIFAGFSAYAEDISGVGLILKSHKNHIQVQEVLPSGPADLAGIKVGEYILDIDGKAAGKDLNKAVASIRGPAGTHVSLTVGDLNSHERTLDMVRVTMASANDQCFIQGTINLEVKPNSPVSPTFFYVSGYVGNQYVIWNGSSGYLNAPYHGELLNLRLNVLGERYSIYGFVHGQSVMWNSGGLNRIYAYQPCIK